MFTFTFWSCIFEFSVEYGLKDGKAGGRETDQLGNCQVGEMMKPLVKTVSGAWKGEELRLGRMKMNRASFWDTGTISEMLGDLRPEVPWGRTLVSLRNWDETQMGRE